MRVGSHMRSHSRAHATRSFYAAILSMPVLLAGLVGLLGMAPLAFGDEEHEAKRADDRSESFRAVTGGEVQRSGEALLVSAYGAIWIILFGVVAMTWRSQRRTEGAIDELRKELKQLEGRLGPHA